MKSPVLGSKIDEYPWIRLLILHIPPFSMTLIMRFSLGAISWMIFIHNLSAYSISCVFNAPLNLLIIQFCLNRRIRPVIINSFLYVNLLVMLVIKWLRLSSMVAMVTIHMCIFGSNNYRLRWPIFFITLPTWSLIPKPCQPFCFNTTCAMLTWIFFSWDVPPIPIW